ncbi:MAG TPA: enoyl-CoA hydratase/isomerase family protein [Gemmatimonadota bacterium]|nr:enoyl-CoA hydratase/isomerase family protein [Gemmatimonadota bacterium]
MIDRQDRGPVAVLRIQRGKVGAIDTELLGRLDDCLTEIEDSDVAAIVLTGSGGCFSAGLDLRRILQGGEPYVNELLAAFRHGIKRLFSMPLPVVAAVNGHAIAGGCVLACCCDRRIMARGDGQIGFPKLKMPLSYPVLATEIVRLAAPGADAGVLFHGGTLLSPSRALDVGLVDEVVSPARLVQRACDLAEELVRRGADAFAEEKEGSRRPVLARVAGASARDAAVDRAWADPQLHSVISDYLKEMTGRG